MRWRGACAGVVVGQTKWPGWGKSSEGLKMGVAKRYPGGEVGQ